MKKKLKVQSAKFQPKADHPRDEKVKEKIIKTSKSKKTSDGKKATLKTQKVSASSEKISNISVTQKISKPKSTAKIEPQARVSSVQAEPQTMEELLKQTGYQLKGLRRGEIREGIITQINKKGTLVDIGAKTEGVILDKEYEEVNDLIANMKVGDKLRCMIYSPENDKGQILLSIKQTAMDHKWGKFDQYLKTGEPIEVRGLEINKGGLIARLMGVRGFVPASQFGHQYLGSLEQLQNRVFKVKVIEVNRQKNRLIFSEKAVSEAQALVQKKAALKKAKVGAAYNGVVSGVMPFGIFVRVEIDPQTHGFLEGLVHISEISWERVTDLNKLFRTGNKVEIKVLGIDENTAKLNLSIKQLTTDPWLDLVKKYPVEKKASGQITRLASFGAFVQLEPGVEGLIHISKIPADLDIKIGQKVDVYVEAVEEEKRRMSLGLVLTEKPVGYK